MEMLPSLPKSSTNHPSPLNPDEEHDHESDSSVNRADPIPDLDLNSVPNVDTCRL